MNEEIMMQQKVEQDDAEKLTCECGAQTHRFKHTPRNGMLRRQLQSRLNRVIGQLGGIKKMLDDERYCGDILMQISAVESALRAIGYMVMQDHMRTCVTEQVRSGNDEIMDETLELMKKLK